MELSERLAILPHQHREALAWFDARQGQEIGWPSRLESGLYLATKAKGIHKPSGWRYALSVRQNLNAPYADKDVTYANDGSWEFEYFQEGKDPSKRDDDFTNRALLANRDDGVPVAVFIQTKGKPNSRYRVMGLALVSEWAGGYFKLRSVARNEPFPATSLEGATNALMTGIDLLPDNLVDARRRINSAIVARQGAGQFRINVLNAFQNRCAISDCDIVEALEAAHIVPYLGAATNLVSNSILLRADIHTLFDRNLLRINTSTMTVMLAAILKKSSYADLEGLELRLPSGEQDPWRVSLNKRYALDLENPIIT